MVRNFAFKRYIIMLGVGLLFLGVTVSLMSHAKAATPSFTLFGDAQLVSPGHNSPLAVQLRSVVPPTSGTGAFGGIDFGGIFPLTFSQIQTLSTDYNFTHNSCGGGSPRFQINIDGKNAFVYIGPPPNYTGCPQNVWLNTGNLACPTCFVDTSQLPGGTFYDTFAAADAKYGTHTVTGIQLVTDAGWFFPDGIQTVLIDNTTINTMTYTYERNPRGR